MAITPRRRFILTFGSVGLGAILSIFLFKIKRNNAALTSQDWFFLGTNFFFGLLIVLVVGFYLARRKDKDQF